MGGLGPVCNKNEHAGVTNCIIVESDFILGDFNVFTFAMPADARLVSGFVIMPNAKYFLFFFMHLADLYVTITSHEIELCPKVYTQQNF